MRATRRFRRAALACLATVASCAVLVGTSGSASAAFWTHGGGSLTPASNATVFSGQNGQPLGNLTLLLKDGVVGGGWAANDFIDFYVEAADVLLPLCDIRGDAHQTAALAATPTVTAKTNNTTAFTGFSVTQSSSPHCPGKDVFRIKLTAKAPSDAKNTVFTISGLRLNLGLTISRGIDIQEVAVASGGQPFGGGSVETTAQVAHVGTSSVSVDRIAGAANGASNVPIGTVTVPDIPGGTITSQLRFQLTGDLFANQPALTAPAGATVTGPNETLPASSLTYTIGGTFAPGGVFTLEGATVDLSNTAVAHYVTVTTGSAAPPVTPLGSATEFATTAAEVRTFAGINRYGTARSLYHAQFATATSAVVASGANFPDALSSDVLARAHFTGVLLTDPTTLSPDTREELQADPITTVYIVGGTAAVSTAVANQIKALHVQNNPTAPVLTVVRISGPDRYATNHAVDIAAGVPGPTRAIITTGLKFADAIAVGPLVYEQGYVLILTDPTTLSPSASATLASLHISHAVILGGTSSVSTNVENQLRSAGVTIDYRIAGADRTATAGMIANWAVRGLPASSPYAALDPGGIGTVWKAADATAFLSRGDGFADALAAGPVAGAQLHVVILTVNAGTLGSGARLYLGGKAGAVTTISTLGSAAAVNPATVDAAVAALG